MENLSSNSASSRSRSSKVASFNVSPLDSTLIRYLQSCSPAASPPIGGGFCSPVLSRSPMTSIENFYTPPSRSPPAFKVEEDVVVMDGILVGDVTRGKARSSFSSSSGRKGRSFLVSESVGSSSPGSVSRQWRDSPNLKVPNVKEELHPFPFANKKKPEAKICTFTSSGSCSYGAKCPYVHHRALESEFPSHVRPMATPKVPRIAPRNLENSSKSNSSINSFTPKSSDWSPLDDGIDCSLPPHALTDKNPPREAVNAYIDGVLYGPSCGKRLPVFAEICPE